MGVQSMDWAFIAAGFAVGLMVGMTAIGAGTLMTAVLALAGVPSPVMVGTNLAHAAIIKVKGGWVHAVKRSVAWRIALLLALGSVPAAAVMVCSLRLLSARPEVLARLITLSLGTVLLFTAVAMLFRPRALPRARQESASRLTVRRRVAATVASGAAIGALVAMTSVGAGALVAVVLFYLYPDLPPARIVGTNIVHAVPLATVAGLGHASLGAVDYALLGNLLLGSLPGIAAGSLIAHRVPEGVLRPVIAATLAVAGGKLVF
ncbi:MAG: sulfite exporter TauE/SafE family protein [Burkholderiales bacterium]|nr:sulfite exporter TauE/SafE family protein [Burkholderiales bacterium]